MSGHDEPSGPRIPIAGAAGAAIHAALAKMATHCGELRLMLDKERVASGGYVYTVTFIQPPARPVPKQR